MYALTEIKGVGRRLSNVICKKADVDLAKRAGELNPDELERIVTILQNPQEFKIPDWMLNRQRGEYLCRHKQEVIMCMAGIARGVGHTVEKNRWTGPVARIAVGDDQALGRVQV